MAPGKLRLKESSSAQPPSSMRRRQYATRSPSPTSLATGMDESSLPPSHAYRARREAEQEGEEELVITWTTTSPRIAAKLLSASSDRAFRERLFEALEEDEPMDALESQYGFSMPSRWRRQSSLYASAARGGVDGMEDEDYAEYVRRGMYRRTHREEVLRLEERELAAARKEKEEREARRRARAKEKERQKRAEEKARRREVKEAQNCREAYAAKWVHIGSLQVNAPPSLRFNDVPWPIYPSSPNTPTTNTIASLTASSISHFLLSHLSSSDSSARKKALRAAVLAYHPDRFGKVLGMVKEEGAGRERARKWGLRVSQVLNELGEKGTEGK